MIFVNIEHVGSFKHFVFVYLCILHLIHRNVIFDSLESHAFKKHVWSFKHFVFVYLQDVCKMCARCAQYVSKMYAYVMFDIISEEP